MPVAFSNWKFMFLRFRWLSCTLLFLLDIFCFFLNCYLDDAHTWISPLVLLFLSAFVLLSERFSQFYLLTAFLSSSFNVCGFLFCWIIYILFLFCECCFLNDRFFQAFVCAWFLFTLRCFYLFCLLFHIRCFHYIVESWFLSPLRCSHHCFIAVVPTGILNSDLIKNWRGKV